MEEFPQNNGYKCVVIKALCCMDLNCTQEILGIVNIYLLVVYSFLPAMYIQP